MTEFSLTRMVNVGEYILNRMSYYQDSLKRFIKSDRPMMLIIGQHGSGKTQLVKHFSDKLSPEYRTLHINGNESCPPHQLVTLICQQWDVNEDPDLTSHRNQLDTLLNQIHQQHVPNVLIVSNAQNLNIATLAAISHLANAQEKPPVSLHIILSGEVNLEDKIQSLMTQAPPSLLLQPLSRKETFQYIKYRLNKLNKSQPISPPNDIIEKIYEHSGGFPSLINHLTQRWLCDEKSIKNKRDIKGTTPPNEPLQQTDTNKRKIFWQKHVVKITSTTCLIILAVGFWTYQHKAPYHHHRKVIAMKRPLPITPGKLPVNVGLKSF